MLILYINDVKEYNVIFEKEFRRLTNDRNRLKKLCERIEEKRLELLRLMGRI